MPRQIVIEFDLEAGGQSHVLHRVLNFNEALYSLARKTDWMSFALDQIDEPTGQRVNVKSARRLRRVSAQIEKLLAEHGLADIARISVVTPPT